MKARGVVAPMAIARLTKALLLLALALVAFITLRDMQRRHPERLPWTPLSLAAPIGPFTAAKITRLTEDAPACRRLLRYAGAAFTTLPPITGPRCGYADGVRLQPGPGARFGPDAPAVACPVAAALLVWEREIVRPAALRHFGTAVTRIDHVGSFNCRRIAGSANMSEHATADAIDIAGFRLADGRRVRVLGDWAGPSPKAAFLRDVRDGACGVFATVLSPDYNAAHADHLHLDHAARGMRGGQVCR